MGLLDTKGYIPNLMTKQLSTVEPGDVVTIPAAQNPIMALINRAAVAAASRPSRITRQNGDGL